MKILIDIDELEQSGVINAQLAKVLREHAICDTGSSAINMLLAFGAIAIAAGILSLAPSSILVALFSLGFIILGWLIKKQNAIQWNKLASIWMVTGALVLSASIGLITNQPLVTSLIMVAVLTTVSIMAESKLLIALVPLTLAALIGSSTGYWHACYIIMVQEPTLTIILFTLLAYGAWQFAKLRKGLLHNLAIIFARVCIILVNFGFWIGSLWGDTPGKIWKDLTTINHTSYVGQQISPMVFIIGWAIALILAGIWGAKHGRKFMVSTVAVFGAIHFYTQWFERLGFHAVAVIVAGLITIIFGLGLWNYNKKELSYSK